jgi:hypothetical protein
MMINWWKTNIDFVEITLHLNENNAWIIFSIELKFNPNIIELDSNTLNGIWFQIQLKRNVMQIGGEGIEKNSHE